jgi:hypothetical protein
VLDSGPGEACCCTGIDIAIGSALLREGIVNPRRKVDEGVRALQCRGYPRLVV